uniref:uncharacterized protein LOC122604556 n=1 Tax=Erigeron canadensis TaxID=72917 RepID=UPI001CB8D078|nr:uncharacterized protein LOC122604556 [Erigeron canadensis]
MADKNLTFLQDINDNSANCTIKVQVLLLWNTFYQKTHFKPSSLDMILVDEQGTKIHGSIHNTLISKFEHMLEEGGFRVISNFDVKSTKSMFLLANHSYRLCFLDDTVVYDSPAFEIPGDKFEFCSFERINNSTVDKTASFDIIGQVIGNKPIRVMGTKQDPRHILECQLRDDNGIVIQCALWDDYGKQLHQYVLANEEIDEPVIILLQLAKFNNWNNKPQVSNCMYGAKLYINENIGPIIEFKESIKLQVMVKDKSGSGPLWIFETGVTKLVKRSASYLINKIKPGDTHHVYPDEFNTILNKSYVFRVEITDYNVKNRYKIFTVFSLSSDTDIIKCVLAQPVTKENAIFLDDDSDEDEKDMGTYSKKKRNNKPSDEARNLKIPKFEENDPTDENIFKENNLENGIGNLKNQKNQKA